MSDKKGQTGVWPMGFISANYSGATSSVVNNA